MKNYFDMKGHVAIVTGCSGGLGVQMAKALANQGCNIVPIALPQIEPIYKSPGSTRCLALEGRAHPLYSFETKVPKPMSAISIYS